MCAGHPTQHLQNTPNKCEPFFGGLEASQTGGHERKKVQKAALGKAGDEGVEVLGALARYPMHNCEAHIEEGLDMMVNRGLLQVSPHKQDWLPAWCLEHLWAGSTNRHTSRAFMANPPAAAAFASCLSPQPPLSQHPVSCPPTELDSVSRVTSALGTQQHSAQRCAPPKFHCLGNG